MNDLTEYQKVRSLMKTGDLIEWRANSLLGEAIRLKTGYDVNHSSLVVILSSPYSGQRRVFLFEALSDGVDVTFLSRKLEQWDGKAYWYSLKDENLTEIPSIEERAFSYLGVPYDYEGLTQQLFGHVQIETTKLFCSEYVQVDVTGQIDGVAFVPGELPEKVQMWNQRLEIL
jgi:hypothetical protein